MTMALYTVGHGNRSLPELAQLLAEAPVALMADVRRYPASRRNPHLGREALSTGLPDLGIAYQWWGQDLGGRRPAVRPSRHPAWQQAAFRAYADHMDSPAFRAAFTRLLGTARETPTAVLCAENLWWRCHRRLIADAALLAGLPVIHLLGPGKAQDHPLSPNVRVGEDGWPVYDQGLLDLPH